MRRSRPRRGLRCLLGIHDYKTTYNPYNRWVRFRRCRRCRRVAFEHLEWVRGLPSD